MTAVLSGSAVLAIMVVLWRSDRPLAVLTIPPAVFVGMAALSAWVADDLVESQDPESPGGRVWFTADLVDGQTLLCLAALGSALGILLVSALRDPAVRSAPIPSVQPSVPGWWFLAASAAMLMMFIAIYGVSTLWERNTYLPSYRWPRLGGVAGLLHLGSFVLAAVASHWTRRAPRVASWLLMVASIVVAYGVGTRLLAVLPLVWLAVKLILTRKVRWWWAVLAAYASVVGVSLALVNRSLNELHGLKPYYSQLVARPEELLLDWDAVLRVSNNVLFSVPLSSIVANTDRFDTKALMVSLDPRRGTDIGWQELASELMVHQYIPFNAIGQMASISPAFLVGLCALFSAIAAGVYSAWMQKSYWLIAVGVFALHMYYSILLLQYNLRSAARFIWLMLALGLLAYLIPGPGRAHKESTTQGPGGQA